MRSDAIQAADDFKPSEQLGAAVDNAETLLRFAAEEGVSIPGNVVASIVDARVKYRQNQLTKADWIGFLSSLTVLAFLLKPVTADSIRACESNETRRRLERNRSVAIILTVVTLLCSAVSFLNHSFSAKIVQEIGQANALAVSLRAGIGDIDLADAADPCRARHSTGSRPQSVDIGKLTQLQNFAALSRDIYKRARKFDFFVGYSESDPYSTLDKAELQLAPVFLNYQAEVLCRITSYQIIRNFSSNVVVDNSYVFGALSQYVLPVLYALVGAFAFRLRSVAEAIRNRTYHPSFADASRLIGAFIVGSVVSLFNLFTETSSLSPLAVAFLAGYAVEVFFSILDALVQTIGRREVAASPASAVTIVHSIQPTAAPPGTSAP